MKKNFMNISILNLQYQILELFREFVKPSEDIHSPLQLYLKKSQNQPFLIAPLTEYSKKSQEIRFMKELFYLKYYTKETIKFFKCVFSHYFSIFQVFSFLQRFDSWIARITRSGLFGKHFFGF